MAGGLLPCRQIGRFPAADASRTPSQGSAGCGGFQRFVPRGGAANGTPTHCRDRDPTSSHARSPSAVRSTGEAREATRQEASTRAGTRALAGGDEGIARGKGAWGADSTKGGGRGSGSDETVSNFFYCSSRQIDYVTTRLTADEPQPDTLLFNCPRPRPISPQNSARF